MKFILFLIHTSALTEGSKCITSVSENTYLSALYRLTQVPY